MAEDLATETPEEGAEAEAAAPPDADPQAQDDENQELEARQVQRWADLWGAIPVLSRADLRVQEAILDEALRDWVLSETVSLCILEDNVIISCEPELPEVEVASSLLALQGRDAEVRPAISEVVRSIRRTMEGSDAQIGDALLEIEDRTETNVSRLFASIIDTALTRNASDIHFEMRDDNCEIRFRVDGQMVRYDNISARETMALGNYMFNSEAKRGSLQFITHMPLHGSMEAQVRGQHVALRLSTAPDIRGVDIFLRVWRPDEASLTLDDLGYTPMQIDLLGEAITRPYGAIIMSGPTGSGKSTSLTAVLERVDPQTKIVSLEEPVERMLPNVTHVAISKLNEWGGWVNLRAGLNRWDSNINMLGEIKDQETAEAIQDLVTSGKLTITTLHAANALSIPARLEDLGVAHTMVCDPNFLVLLVNQRLMPRLCTQCRVPYTQYEGLTVTMKERFDRRFGTQADQVYLRGPGCNACGQTGIQGRLLVAEMIMVDEVSRTLIRDRDVTGWRRHLLGHGWLPIMDHACTHLFDGLVDPRSVEQAAGRLDKQESEAFDYAKLKALHMQGRMT